MKNLKRFAPYFISFLIALVPVIWFWGKGSVLIDGIDTNFPLDPKLWFLRRFFVWNNILNAGVDYSSSTAGMFFHFVQYVFYLLHFSLQKIEILSLIFWFALIVSSAYFLGSLLFKRNFFIVLLFVILYCFNTYFFNSWENVKAANLSVMASIPLGLSIFLIFINEIDLLSSRKKNISFFKITIFIIALGIILSGSAINPAYYLTFFLIIFLFVVIYLVTYYSKNNFRRVSLFFIYFFIVVNLVNLYWILPTAHFIYVNIPAHGSIEKIGFSDWLESLSENTGLINVIRMLGAWDWYTVDRSTGEPLFIPYATKYFYNIWFIIFSFTIPGLALASSFLINQKTKIYYLFFYLLSVFAIFLGVGAHQPTGQIFLFFSRHLPFFTLFRSPWYIFTPMLVISYAGLVSLLFFNLKSKLPSLLINILVVGLIVANLIYSYPLVLGRIFRPGRNDSFYVHFPDYVFEAKDWLDKEGQGRIIGFPDDSLERFNWGYRGIESLLELLSSSELLYSPINDTDLGINNVINQFYHDLKYSEITSALKISNALNVRYLLDKEDTTSLSIPLPGSITKMPLTVFGAWNFYQLSNSSSKLYLNKNYYLASNYSLDPKYLGVIDNYDILLSQNDSSIKKITNLDQTAGELSTAKNSQIGDYQYYIHGKDVSIESRYSFPDLTHVDYSFSNLAGGSYQLMLERYKLEDFGLDLSKPILIEVNGLKKELEIEKVDDSYVYFRKTMLPKGTSNIRFFLFPENAVINGDFQKIPTFLTVKLGESLIERDNNSNILTLTSRNNNGALVAFPLSKFDPLGLYILSLRYKRLVSSGIKLSVNQLSNSSPLIYQEATLASSADWTWYHTYFAPAKTNSSVKVNVVIPQVLNESEALSNRVYVSSIWATKVFTNQLIAKKSPQLIGGINSKVSLISKTPAEYSYNINSSAGPQTLVFLENYSPDWSMDVYGENDQKLKINPIHFTANLYANGWYVPGAPANFKVRIYYWPQYLYLIGWGGAIISILGFLIFAWVIKKKNERV